MATSTTSKKMFANAAAAHPLSQSAASRIPPARPCAANLTITITAALIEQTTCSLATGEKKVGGGGGGAGGTYFRPHSGHTSFGNPLSEYPQNWHFKGARDPITVVRGCDTTGCGLGQLAVHFRESLIARKSSAGRLSAYSHTVTGSFFTPHARAFASLGNSTSSFSPLIAPPRSSTGITRPSS
jgi:hypothetical protein